MSFESSLFAAAGPPVCEARRVVNAASKPAGSRDGGTNAAALRRDLSGAARRRHPPGKLSAGLRQQVDKTRQIKFLRRPIVQSRLDRLRLGGQRRRAQQFRGRADAMQHRGKFRVLIIFLDSYARKHVFAACCCTHNLPLTTTIV
jgi:hypothetical protein